MALNDIYWTKATVDALDGTGTVNTFNDPFGIDWCFDNCQPGEIIRIVEDGTHFWGSGSTSWTNRTNTNKSLSTGVAGTNLLPIRVEGWINESTPGMVRMDFDQGTGSGINCNHVHHIWRNIRVTRNQGAGGVSNWALNTSNNLWIDCEADDADYYGFGQGTGGPYRFVRCKATNAGRDGWRTSSAAANYWIACESYDNTWSGYYSTGFGIWINSLARDNGGHGFYGHNNSSGHILFECTSHDNGNDDYDFNTSHVLLYRCGGTKAVNYGLYIQGNDYYAVDIDCSFPVTGGPSEQNTNARGGSGTPLFVTIDEVTDPPSYVDEALHDLTPSEASWLDLARAIPNSRRNIGAFNPATGGSGGGLMRPPRYDGA